MTNSPVFVITNVSTSDGTTFFNGRRWSSERPDAKEYPTRRAAEADLKYTQGVSAHVTEDSAD